MTAGESDLFGGPTDDAYVLAQRAYVWGFAPLVAARLREQSTNPDDPFAARAPTSAGAALNNLGHQRRLSDPTLLGVAPNVDTLYSLAWLDLAQEPFVLEAPDFGSRYYTFQFGHADTATELSLGARTHGSQLPPVFACGARDATPVPEGMVEVRSPTRYLMIAGRILVRPSDPVDQRAVADLQAAIRLRALSRYHAGAEGPNPVPGQCRLADGADRVAPELRSLVELGNLLRDWDVAPEERELVASFAAIGVTREHGFVPGAAADELARGLEQAKALVERKTGDLGRRANGWTINYDGPRFGRDYLLRAAVAETQVYVTVPEEALYPVAQEDADGVRLTGETEYRVVFAADALPPVDAFWSLTVYRRDPLPLVPNPIERYAIGDRTPGLVRADDGSLAIRIAHAQPPPDLRGNWLPAPAGPFHLMLRLYHPRPSAVDGSWLPPQVEKGT